MAFLGKVLKEDLRSLAEELGEEITPNLKVVDLKKIIMGNENYEEEFVKGLLETIANTRKERIDLEKEKERERIDFEKEKEKERIALERERLEAEREKDKIELEKKRMEFEIEKLKIENSNSVEISTDGIGRLNNSYGVEFSKLMPKFNVKEDDIVLYLAIFERQAKRVHVEPKHWVSSLLSLLPSDIIQILARESEEKFEDYNYIKDILLKRFKLSPERFRKKFMQHQRTPEKTWREFAFELNGYFQEWVDGLKIHDFKSLKELIVTDQLKRRVPYEVREHFIDEWPKIISPSELADKLDIYENVREDCKKSVKGDKRETFTEKKSQILNDFKQRNRNMNQSYKKFPTNITAKSEKYKASFIPTCFACGAKGHMAKACTSIARKSSFTTQSNVMKIKESTKDLAPDVLTAKISTPVYNQITRRGNVDNLQLIDIKCGKATLSAVIDTGAQISVVREDLVKDEIGEGDGTIQIISAFGESEIAILRILNLKINDGIHSEVPITCAVSKKLVNDMLISSSAFESLSENIQMNCCVDQIITKVIEDDDRRNSEEMESTFEDKKNEQETPQIQMKTVNSITKASNENRNKFVTLQREDENLKKLWEYAEKEKNSFKIRDGVLIHSEYICGENVDQVVLPSCKRKEVLKMAHEVPLAGHLGEQKTKQRIKYSFFWPSIKYDVKKFCESCKICQVRKTVSYRDRIPIQPIVRPDTPFEVWSVDCIGPLEPPSRRGHKYVICAVDLCTRWAEAIPVTNISAKSTCNSLMKIFVQTGFPKVICSDQGTNFTSKLTEAFLEVIGVSPRFSTPGHPESMGAVERWNRTLKDMLNKNIQEHGSDWDVHLPYLLFAYREVPHSTTGMSPFQLVYGRLPTGPLSLLKDVWTGERKIPTSASVSVENYLSEVIEKLRRAHEIASENSSIAQERYISQYNLRARDKCFKVGDKVLILLPSSTHKLLNTWIGPATVVQITRPYSAIVELENGSRRELHFNKLRPYIARIEHVGLIFEEDKEFGEIHYAPSKKSCLTPKEILSHIDNLGLSLEKHNDLKNVICSNSKVFSNIPGIANVEGHSVRVTSECSPKRLHPYRIPIIMQREVDRQIQELLALGLIERSDSEWAHPVVCVAKKDGSVRLCIDFRLLNSYTIPDVYPMKIANDLIYLIGNSKFISVLDLTKGYWQIPMKEDCKRYTAFVTHSGHYQWRVMPFGMKNAGSTFQKSIDKILENHKEYCRSYIDDVAIFSKTWTEHIEHLGKVLETLGTVGLTVNLKKCDFGKNEVKFLGHVIGSGRHTPDPEKTEAIRKMSRPTTKRELRSVLGLANYYRDYILNFASIVLPLTDLTKKGIPNEIPWTDSQEKAFQKLKQHLMDMPSLYTPNIGRPFQLYTDASGTAVGACLSQFDESGNEHPIAFYSKKLSSGQMKWSTIEREAYSVLTSLQKFDTWIFGAEIEVVSDHNPLTYLTKTMPQGAKLARWALALQRYNLKITYRKGKRHGNADSLSRLPQNS